MSINIHILETGSVLIELGYRVQLDKNKEIGKENIDKNISFFSKISSSRIVEKHYFQIEAILETQPFKEGLWK